MSVLRLTACEVQFTEGGLRMLIDGKPSALPRLQVEVKNLAEVNAAIASMKAELGKIDPARFARGEFVPNGYKILARIVQGRKPNGFNQIPRAAFEVRKEAA